MTFSLPHTSTPSAADAVASLQTAACTALSDWDNGFRRRSDDVATVAVTLTFTADALAAGHSPAEWVEHALRAAGVGVAAACRNDAGVPAEAPPAAATDEFLTALASATLDYVAGLTAAAANEPEDERVALVADLRALVEDIDPYACPAHWWSSCGQDVVVCASRILALALRTRPV